MKIFLPPANKVGKGNVLISMCLFRAEGGVCLVQVPSRGGEMERTGWGGGGQVFIPGPRYTPGRYTPEGTPLVLIYWLPKKPVVYILLECFLVSHALDGNFRLNYKKNFS